MKYNVVVSDSEGTIVFLEQVEIGNEEQHLLTPVIVQKQAREAVCDVAESIRLGVL